MATDLIDWKVEILLDIQGVPDPGIERAVRIAAIEFCEETLLWKYALTRINVASGTVGYALTPPSDSRLIGIESVLYKANSAADTTFDPLDPISQDQKDLFSTTAWRFESGTPVGYYHDEDITPLNLYPIPDASSTSGLLVTVHLIPTDDCTSIDDFLWNMYHDAIGAGAQAYLLSKKDMPWYDPGAAMDRRNRFIGFIDSAIRKMGRKYIPKADKESRPKT
uniref:Uncharacterized protein n=1 Tax=viral metagenome TaxID=1070528 RepID=A0A6M3JPE1_9ZZZZ